MYRIRPLSAVGTDSSAVTRAALIDAAAPLFADLGFEATRARDIADKAKANVSAINYHFGSNWFSPPALEGSPGLVPGLFFPASVLPSEFCIFRGGC